MMDLRCTVAHRVHLIASLVRVRLMHLGKNQWPGLKPSHGARGLKKINLCFIKINDLIDGSSDELEGVDHNQLQMYFNL